MTAPVPSALAQPARLELRLIAQSGYPTAAPARPLGCVFDDPPGVVAVTAGLARRFEVQARVVDTDPADGVAPSGLAALDFSISSTRAGTWARARLTNTEAATTADPSAFNTGRDCSGISPSQGLHGAFRGWDPPGPSPRNTDPRNGVISPSGIANIHTEPVDSLTGARWVALYTFEFALPAGAVGDAALLPRVEPVAGVSYVWVGSRGEVFTGSAWTSAGLLLRAPAGPFACCVGSGCYIALTPSACFANGGGPARGTVCTPAACCPADLNDDNAATVQDILDFVALYLASDPAADFDDNGSLTTNDIFAFLAAYFTPCF
ncbi:MAG: GC-type dockerin domain-anchored protein [Phycisphaerales bacterium]